MDVLVVAEEAAGAQALRLVAERGHRVVAALTASEAGRAGTVAAVAEGLGVPRMDPALVREAGFAAWIRARGLDLLLNVHALEVVHADVLAAPRIGAFNLHPGPLPRYAGLNAPSWAILAGETRHAVTVHRMVADVDAGPIAYEAWFDVAPEDTGLRVAAACARLGVPLLGRLLDDAAAGADRIPAIAQDPGARRWHGRAAPYGGRLPWRLPSRRLVDLVRAADYSPFPSPWGHPRTTLDGEELEVVRVAATGELAGAPPGRIGERRGDGVLVACGDGWVLVERVRREGEPLSAGVAMTPGRQLAPGPSPAQEVE